ncbi:MAG: YIP1 family protein [Thermoplasmata archaeon]|nr:YIP1 family protein [Thermoplasmata archaeon]
MTEIGFGERVKGFLLSPVETFQKVKDEDLGPLMKYFVVLTLIFSILMAVIMIGLSSAMLSILPVKLPFMAGTAAGGLAAVVTFITLLISLLIGLFIVAAIVHIFVYLLGGRKGYTQTVKAMGYGMTPSLLLGWIPFLNIIVGIWALIVEIIGIRELQEMSTGKAVLAVILPGIIIGIIVGIAMWLAGPEIPSYPTP